jgi:hypothetical protein
VQQSLATGRVISHQVVVSGVALMRSPQAVSRPCGKPPNGKQHSAASSTAMQNGPASPDQLDNGEPHRAASSTASRTVPHHRTSSPGVVFLRSHKLFVDPAENTCRLHRRTGYTAQGFGGLFCSEVGLKIWPSRSAPASPTPSLRGLLWRTPL